MASPYQVPIESSSEVGRGPDVLEAVHGDDVDDGTDDGFPEILYTFVNILQ